VSHRRRRRRGAHPAQPPARTRWALIKICAHASHKGRPRKPKRVCEVTHTFASSRLHAAAVPRAPQPLALRRYIGHWTSRDLGHSPRLLHSPSALLPPLRPSSLLHTCSEPPTWHQAAPWRPGRRHKEHLIGHSHRQHGLLGLAHPPRPTTSSLVRRMAMPCRPQ